MKKKKKEISYDNILFLKEKEKKKTLKLWKGFTTFGL